MDKGMFHHRDFWITLVASVVYIANVPLCIVCLSYFLSLSFCFFFSFAQIPLCPDRPSMRQRMKSRIIKFRFFAAVVCDENLYPFLSLSVLCMILFLLSFENLYKLCGNLKVDYESIFSNILRGIVKQVLRLKICFLKQTVMTFDIMCQLTVSGLTHILIKLKCVVSQ